MNPENKSAACSVRIAQVKDILIKAKEMDALPFSATFRSRQINGSKIDYYFE